MKLISFLLTFLITILLILLLWNRIVITVFAGEEGVLFKRWTGTVVDKVYGEGIYLILPWDKITKYNIRVQEHKDNFKVLSKQGLTINLKISVRYRPDKILLGILHQNIGPNYLESAIIPEVESIIRRYFSKFDDNEIYTSKGAILEKIIVESREKLSNKFIILEDLVFREIIFPKDIEYSIESKIIEYHKYKEYEYKLKRAKLEAYRKEIEAEGIAKYKDIISNNITNNYLVWNSLQATMKLNKSKNSNIIIMGSGDNGLPTILNKKLLGKKVENILK